MATSPAPDAAAPPGMCPGVAVLGGGGGSGDGSGGGSGGKDGSGGDGHGSGEDGSGDGKDAQGAPDYEKYPKCGYASHPVDVVTGRAFTHPSTDLDLPGPLPLRFRRMYSSKMAGRDMGLGYGWGHTFGWCIEVGRREIRVWNEQGIAVDFPRIEPGGEVLGPWGWLLRREAAGFWLDAGDGVFRVFSSPGEGANSFRLSSVEDRNQNRISLRYEGERLVEIADSAGRLVRLPPARDGHIGAIEVKNAVAQGQWVAFATYAYDDQANLIAATDAGGFTARYAYDQEHRLTADTDRSGLCFHFVYDREGRCVESWGDYPGRRDASLIDELPATLADGTTPARGIHHCAFSYLPGFYSEVADSTQVRRFFGNRHGTLDKEVAGSAVTVATYRDDGHILSETDALGATKRFERDARGRLTKVTDPLGRVTVIDRDEQGLPVKITDAAGGVTVLERDRRGNLLVSIDAAGGTESYRYDDRGSIVEHTNAAGARSVLGYDDQGNLISLALPNGGVLRFTYDALGRLLSRVDPLGAETRYTYSRRGDLVSVRDALGQATRYAYDGEGHLTSVVDPKGSVTSLTWGGYHKLCARRDANGHEVKLRYNLEGELREVYNERGEVHRLTYSGSGLLLGESTFDGRELRYRRDAAGRVTRAINGLGEPTDLEYDLAGQLTRRVLPEGGEESFEYDALGNLVSARSPSGEFSFTRDALGRVVREAQSVRGDEHWTEVGYDPTGQRVSRKTSLGHVEAVKRDALGGRAETTLDGTHAVAHEVDLLGREVVRSLPGGGFLQSAYDALGRVAGRRAGSGGDLRPWSADAERVTVELRFRYDESGELAESWDRSRGTTRYAYDPVGQLLSMVPERARGEVFRYDPTGNVYEAGADEAARVYGKGNRLLRKGDTAYTWDRDGRLVEKRRRAGGPEGEEVWRYRWSEAGLLKEVERPDGVIAAFGYDPFARRVSKRVTAAGESRRDRVLVSETRFVWDGDVLVHEVETRAREAGDPVVEERTYWFEDEGFEPVAHREKGEWFYYLNDPIGTPERLLGDDGRVAGELRREAWGETEESGRARTEIRFQGQYEDDEIRLRYNRFRYYDTSISSFISPDPIGLRGGFNAFTFPGPTTSTADPWGLAPKTAKAFQRPIDFPSPSSVNVDMAHILSGHTKEGDRAKSSAAAGKGKDCFPSNMSEEDIERNVRKAYKNADTAVKYKHQDGDSKVVLQGNSGGMRIEMWYNKTTRTIESAYPAGNPTRA